MAKNKRNINMPRPNIMWLWSAITLVIIGYWIFSNEEFAPVKSDWATVERLVESGDVEKIVVVNRDEARVELKEGKDVTILTIGAVLYRALEAAKILEEKYGISAEIIDARSIVPFNYDKVLESVKKTGRLVIVHEAHKIAGWGSQVAAEVMEKAFKYLDAPIQRLGAKHCPLAFNLGLENAIVPQISDIVEACKAVLYK